LLQNGLEGVNLSQNQRHQLWKYIDTEKLNHITKEKFLEKFNVSDELQNQWSPAIVEKIFNTVKKHKVSLASTFYKIDKSNKKSVDLKQFRAVLEGMNVLSDCPLSKLQIFQLFNVVDKNGDGEVQYSEFLEYFEVKDTAHVPRIIPAFDLEDLDPLDL